jgi:hypothetical protein
MREIEQYYSYLVMPEDRDPSEDLKKANMIAVIGLRCYQS